MRELFPSARDLKMTWHSVVKIQQSLYREAPGLDPFRPDQKTPVPNFFLAGSYTKQVLYACSSCAFHLCTGACMHLVSPTPSSRRLSSNCFSVKVELASEGKQGLACHQCFV